MAVNPGGFTWVYNTLLTSQGIDPSKIDTVPREVSGIDPLIKGEVDAITGWFVNEGIQVQEAGYEPNFILMSDYGVDTYTSVIFTTERMIAEHPDVVERFLRALIAGMKDTAANPDQVVEFALRYDKSLDLEAQRRRLQASLPLLNPASSKPGLMQPDILEISHQILLDQGMLDKPIDIEAAYTLAFLEEIYNK